jgi:hypothetical protein
MLIDVGPLIITCVPAGAGVTEGVTDGVGEPTDGVGEAPAIDVVVAFAVEVVLAVPETLGLVPVFVVEKRQPASDNEAIITSTTITATFVIIHFASISS